MMRISSCLLLAGVVLSGTLLGVANARPGVQTSAERDAFFEAKIRPLLFEKCLMCHGAEKQMAGLRLDSREAALKGRDTGVVLTPGDAAKSTLLRAVRFDSTIKMPPSGKLSPAEIANLTKWIEMGAPWPAAKAGAASGPKHVTTAAQRSFWSFQPIRAGAAPTVKTSGWASGPIDKYILAELEKTGLAPAKAADRRTLIRRATFDLTGLPPAPTEVEAFLVDRAPGAFVRVVDRLLASPRYGERWARHWLDVARYADSMDARGVGGEGDIADAWRYRDWVVKAFNSDMPYDQFMLNQVAGDILPGPGGDGFNREGTIATGLLAVGNWGNGDADKEKILTDIADDQVDVVSRGFMGLTVACARCHHHKFDPISTQDYYALAGIFFSTHILPKLTPKGAGETPMRVPLISKAEMARREATKAKLAELDKALADRRAAASVVVAKAMLPDTPKYVKAALDYVEASRAGGEVQPVEEAAKAAGLKPYALRQWLSALGVGDYALMTNPVKNLAGLQGVMSWQAAGGLPSLTVNQNPDAKPLATYILPPKSVCVHPGPASGVAVGWKSPISGVVRVSGLVSDADIAAGDGVAWILDHRTAAGPRELAKGDLANAAKATFGTDKPVQVSVRPGDILQLLILPKMAHTCDTTHLELSIKPTGGPAWNLSDIVADPLEGDKGNPHSDTRGNPGVWRFYDMSGSSRTGTPTDSATPLGRLRQALVSGDSTSLSAAAGAFSKEFAAVDASSPFAVREAGDEMQFGADDLAAVTNLRKEIAALRATPIPPTEYANAAQEGGVPESSRQGIADTRVHIRGSYERLGETVPRRFPVILASETQPRITEGSGRLQLGKWLGSPSNPLPARVMVNRIWQHHFGEGIVRTPSNFGFLGERPSHPALLDYLAKRFVGGGWSVKRLHRELMLTSTYGQSSGANPRTQAADPDNRLFGRMARRRLESEAVRDALLWASGTLDERPGGVGDKDFNMPRRSLYQMTVRSDRTGFGPLFDVADSTGPIERRTVSTVAPQALFLMNHPFVLKQAEMLAARVERDAPAGAAARIDFLYRLLFGRPPVSVETAVATRLLGAATKADLQVLCQTLLCTNEFIYVD